MIDKKEAYRILGLKEGSSRVDIENRYDLLLKRFRQLQIEGKETLEDGSSLTDVNNAYKALTAVDVKQAGPPRKPNPLLKKMNIDEEKTRNFFYYYKFHMIAAIVLIALAFSIIRGCVTKVEPDMNMAVIGNFPYFETEVLANEIKEKVPGLQEISIELLPLSKDGKSPQDVGITEKVMVLMAVGDLDVCIMDVQKFELFAKQGAFLNLDELAVQVKADRDKNSKYIIKTELDPTPHLYGIDIKESSVMKDLKIPGDEKILAIKGNAKHPEKAVEVFRLLAEQ